VRLGLIRDREEGGEVETHGKESSMMGDLKEVKGI